jgi:hypothetical protein
MAGFKRDECICVHTPKGHKTSGRCKNGCRCTAGLLKAVRKGR